MTSSRLHARKTLRRTFKHFYETTILPQSLAEGFDPVHMFNETMKCALALARQERLDERRSSHFTLKH